MRSSLVVTDSMIWTAETEYALAVAGAEAGAGADVTLAAPGGSEASRRVPDGVAFLALPGDDPSRSPADFVADARVVAGLVERMAPSVVHSSRPSAHLLCAAAVGRRAPLVHLRGSASRPSGTLANRALYRRTSVVVVSSSRIRDWVVSELRVPPSRVVRLLSPVETSWFRETAPADLSEFGIPRDARVVLNVARLAPIKGHGVLLRAFAEVVAEEPRAVLLLVGEPWSGEPEGLRALAAQLGIESSVVFAGRRPDVRSIVASAEVCVTSSVGSEENSRSVGEYMASGRPVVATAVGVIPELVVEGETGLVVGAGDAPAMARALIGLLANAERSAAMGAAGREVARREFSREAFVRGLDEALSAAGVVL